MTLRVVPYQAEHLERLKLQPAQGKEFPALSREQAEHLKGTAAYSAMGDDGTVYAVAGIAEQWPGRAIAWAMVGYNAGPHFVQITREARRFLDGCGYERVEASVDALFPAAARWAELLGFERETAEPMRRYLPGGRPAYLYARITESEGAA